MKKFLLSLLILIVGLGLLAGAGFAGYRIGVSNRLASTGAAPELRRPFQMHPQFMPRNDFGRGFDHYSMMRPGGFNGRSIGFFSPLRAIWNIALLGLVLWFVYWLFTKSGWQITRKTDVSTETNSTDSAGN